MSGKGDPVGWWDSGPGWVGQWTRLGGTGDRDKIPHREGQNTGMNCCQLEERSDCHLDCCQLGDFHQLGCTTTWSAAKPLPPTAMDCCQLRKKGGCCLLGGTATNCGGLPPTAGEGWSTYHGRINSKAKDITTKEKGKVNFLFSQRFITVKTI